MILIGCAGQNTKSILDESATADIFANDHDSAILAENADSANDPDLVNADQTELVDSEMLDNVTFPDSVEDFDQLVDPDNTTQPEDVVLVDQEIDPDLEEDFSVDADVSDPDQTVETDSTNPIDTEYQDNQDSTPDQFVEDDNSTLMNANVSVASWPIGAQTDIVGMGIDYSDQTPFEIVLEYGTYEITMTHPNYVTYSGIFTVPDELELTVILEQEQVDQIEVTFTSAIPGVEAVYVKIDSPSGQEYATPFTRSFESNSQHTIYCSKNGYLDESFVVEVGEAPFEYPITLQPFSYESMCGWINDEFEFVEGTEPPVENVFVEAVVFDNHCEITGLEPPIPVGSDYYLYGEYESIVYNQLMFSCYAPCSGVECFVHQEIQVIECSYIKDSIQHLIVWHKVN